MKRKKYEAHEKIDLKTLRDLIITLDGYRVHHYEDTESLDRAIKEGKLGRRFVKEWKEIRPNLMKMASMVASLPNVMTLIKTRDAINFISMIFLTIAFALVITRMLTKFSLGLVELVFPSALILLFTSIISRFLINRKIGLEIEAYYAKHPEKFGVERLRLKGTIQKLLNILSNRIRRLGEDPNNCVMKLYNFDYKKIKVIGGTSRLRKYYTVVPEV